MLSKESKIRTLENFHALDYVFFGKPITEIRSCCPLVKEEYMSIKGALLSVHIEMLKLVEHTPEVIDEKVDSSELIKQAKASARIARENSQAIVTTDKSRATIKQTLKEMFKENKDLNLVEEMQNQIRQQAFSLAIDNLLIGRIVDESVAFDKLNEWEGTIIEDSYKILRVNLVESAYEILESKDELAELSKATKQNMKQGAKGGGVAGAVVGAGIGAAGAKVMNAIGIKTSAKRAAAMQAAASGVGGAVTGTAAGAIKAKLNRNRCKKLYPNDAAKYKACTNKLAWGAKKK